MGRARLRWTLSLVGGLLFLVAAAAVAVKQPLLWGAAPLAPPPVDPERLARHVRMLSETLAPRSAEHVDALERAADYISAQLARGGVPVTDQRFEARGGSYRNVIARYGPETGALVVVGAHYDAWGGHPGADDNASGVAALLELGHHLAQQPPPAPVELVAYTLEEPPHFRSSDMGSWHHAQGLVQAGRRVRAMFSLEMLGTFSDAPGSQRFPLPLLRLLYPDTGNYIVVVGKLGQGGLVRRVKRAMQAASDLPVESINAPRFVPGVDFSDHASYWDAGFEAVMVTDTAFYRNPRYHTAGDTWDTLDYPRMAKVVQGVYCAVHALAR